MEREIKHLNDLLDQALKEKEEAEIKIDKAKAKITDDRYSPIERLMLIKSILGDKEND